MEGRGTNPVIVVPGIPLDKRNQNRLAKEMAKTILAFAAAFAVWLVISLMQVRLALYTGAIVWVVSAFTVWRMPNEADKIINRLLQFIVGYSLGLLLWGIIVRVVVATPAAMWTQMIGVSLNGAYASTFVGWMAIAFTIALVMGFFSYMGYIWQLFNMNRSREQVDERRAAYMRNRSFGEGGGGTKR